MFRKMSLNCILSLPPPFTSISLLATPTSLNKRASSKALKTSSQDFPKTCGESSSFIFSCLVFSSSIASWPKSVGNFANAGVAFLKALNITTKEKCKFFSRSGWFSKSCANLAGSGSHSSSSLCGGFACKAT